ncbi:MAG: sensor domain-containing diguanylate cyclase, partial [Candidatus Limnocylindrales bacterium]
TAPLTAALPGRAKRHVTAHGGAGSMATAATIGLQRSMQWIRILGIVLIVAIALVVPGVSIPTLVAGISALAAVVMLQRTILDRGATDLRTLAIAGLAGDSIAGYLLGQAFVATPEWAHFAGYPLLALEGAVVLGSLGAAASTAASSLAFLIQQNERVLSGLAQPGAGFVVVVLGVYVVFGVFCATYAGLNRRMRGDLTAILEVSSLLARQESPTRIVQALDARLRELLGARIRSLAVRRADGGYDILRWRTPETRVISPDAVKRLSAHLGSDIEAEIRVGRALTIRIDGVRDEIVVTALGLPDWVRAITLVPIASDGHLSGILPVLWDRARLPSGAELDLLTGFAQQTGLAFEQAQLHRTRELAATDSLTGLANHRAFRDALAARLSEARRYKATVSILFCDLDHFKQVNDRHGHAAGDVLLHGVASAIRAAARTEDIVARYGGDEIALLLPETGRFGALDLARRLREQVRSVDPEMGIDLTVGVAVFPEDAETPDALVARADAAMYAGKRLGGGRVVLASALPPEA